ncbi:MAG: TonB-dependent receptor, partial [Bryobacteraceae bacterium]
MRAEATGFTPFEALQLEIAGTRALDIPLTLEITRTEVTVSDTARLELDSSSNASSLVLKGEDLDTLSDNPDDLQAELQALAGPAAGPNGGEIFVDGFSGARLPPKSAIREIRINRNPFSAEYDHPGFGRIEILTKPGTDQFHGQAFFHFGGSRLNARNPFAPTKPEAHLRFFNFSLSGPVARHASFSLDADRHTNQQTSVISTAVLDATHNVTRFSQAVLSPMSRTLISPRLDVQLSPAHTLSLRYAENRLSQENWGVGQLSLLSRAMNSSDSDHTLQLTETAVLGPSAINEIRAQWIRRATRRSPLDTQPAISVQGAFEAGGSPAGLARDSQTRWEVQDVTTLTRGTHLVKFGGRLRGVALGDYSTQNYNGTFVFPSLEAYRITLTGLANGLSWSDIRASGGGPSLFSPIASNPLARLRQADAGLFVQDDWRFRQNFSL